MVTRKISVKGEELIPQRSIAMEDKWMEAIKDLFHYLFCTMGNYMQVDTPYSNETRLDENGKKIGDITGAYSIKPTRDGYSFLQNYCDLYPNTYNRIMRALLDTCGRFESLFHDATTTFLVFSCALLIATKSKTIWQAYEYVNKIRLNILRYFELQRIEYSSDNVRKYIKTAISCIDSETIEEVTKIILDAPRGSINVAAVDFPPEGSKQVSKHLFVEQSDGCRIVLYSMTPYVNISLLKVVPIIIQDCTLDGATLTQFININSEVFASRKDDVFTLIICKYYDSQDKLLNQLLDRYKIILSSIQSQYLENFDCINVLKKVLGSPVVYKDTCINQDVVEIIISVEQAPDSSHKILSINTPQMQNFAPGEVSGYVAAAYSCNSSMNKEVLARNRFIFNLLYASKVKLHLQYNSSHEKIMAIEKLRDVSAVHGSDLFSKGFLPSVYKLLDTGERIFQDDDTDNFVEKITYLAKSISFPFDEHKKGEYIDLYEAAHSAIDWACDFALTMKRTVFSASDMEG
ncbi:MAG: hypothetical protein ACRCX2_22225 [Paraclostridium sp.]